MASWSGARDFAEVLVAMFERTSNSSNFLFVAANSSAICCNSDIQNRVFGQTMMVKWHLELLFHKMEWREIEKGEHEEK